jgi:hypothetical protein
VVRLAGSGARLDPCLAKPSWLIFPSVDCSFWVRLPSAKPSWLLMVDDVRPWQ